MEKGKMKRNSAVHFRIWEETGKKKRVSEGAQKTNGRINTGLHYQKKSRREKDIVRQWKARNLIF